MLSPSKQNCSRINIIIIISISTNYRSNKSLQKYFSALEHSLQGMELLQIYGTKFDRTKHGSLFLSKVQPQCK